MDKIETLSSAGTLLAMLFSAATPSPEAQAVAFCVAGGLAGGWVASGWGPDTDTRERGKRMATNFCAALFLGPALGDYAVQWLPGVRPIFVHLLAGGACGVMGVGLLVLLKTRLPKWGVAMLKAWIKMKK